MTNAPAAAKQIRQDLKTAFPNVKFAVTSKKFSMGDSVTIRWTEGPASADVSRLTAKYRIGHHDGMVDCYEFSNKRVDVPQVMFIETARMTEEEAAA